MHVALNLQPNTAFSFYFCLVICLIGNKIDLIEQQEVTPKEGRDYAEVALFKTLLFDELNPSRMRDFFSS
jgi:hypothetical protein